MHNSTLTHSALQLYLFFIITVIVIGCKKNSVQRSSIRFNQQLRVSFKGSKFKL